MYFNWQYLITFNLSYILSASTIIIFQKIFEPYSASAYVHVVLELQPKEANV